MGSSGIKIAGLITSIQYDQIFQDLLRPYRCEPHLCLHEHLHQDGLATGDAVVALSAMDSGSHWRDGRVCDFVAASHCKDAFINSLYV